MKKELELKQKKLPSLYDANTSKYAVEMLNITKTFNNGQLIANDNLTLKVEKNEIHALVGENGAGKTTIMSILFGTLPYDSGKVIINGKEQILSSASDARRNGLGMVHQHFKLVNVYTLLDNIILGAEMTKNGFLDRKSARKKIEKLSAEYNLPVNLDTLSVNASVGEQQRTEILKLLYRDADILIFDEPTAVLSDEEIKGFLKMVLEFKKQGKTIILITHKLNEVKAVADRASIIRKGRLVKTVDVKKVTEQDMANEMVGYKLVLTKNNVKDSSYDKRPVICDIKNLNAYKLAQPKVLALKNFDLKIHEGEILGLAGIEGNGQTELALILGGLLKNRVTGSVTIYNVKSKTKIDVIDSKVKTLYDNGLCHVPEDRLKYGLVLDESVSINAVLPQIDKYPFTVFGFLNRKQITTYAKSIISEWDVRGANDGKAKARSLSGGNQQKLVIGRELSRPHNFAIFVQPTRGLDLGAINYIHQRIIQDAKNGTAVLLISYELDEILSISTRIAVIDSGKIVYDSPAYKTNRATIAKYLSHSTSVIDKKISKQSKTAMKSGKGGK